MAEHAVFVHITTPDDELSLDEIEEPLTAVLDETGAGQFDGNEIGPDGAMLYLYGADADVLFAAVEPILRAADLPAGSWVTKRYGEPGAPEDRVDLA